MLPPSLPVGREVVVIGTGQSWGPHEGDRCVNSVRSFSTPPITERAFGIPSAQRCDCRLCGQAGASLVIKVCGTEIIES